MGREGRVRERGGKMREDKEEGKRYEERRERERER